MQISYSGSAFESLIDVVNYVETMNTLRAGIRWLNKFEIFVTNSLSNPALIQLCNNKTFYDLELRCLNFNDWVIAFSVEGDKILIETILHSSRLVD